MNSTRFITITSALVLMAGTLTSAGCGKPAAAPGGVSEQQKGVMGGTPPPGELAKINAMQADQSRRQAEGQAAARAAAQSGK